MNNGLVTSLHSRLERFVVKVIDPVDSSASTAFFVNNKGFLLTCWHVIEPDFAGVTHASVMIEYRNRKYRASVKFDVSNRDKDLAVLAVDGTDFDQLQEQGFEIPRLGTPYFPADPVAALGYQRQDVLADPILLRGYIDPDNPTLEVSLYSLLDRSGCRVPGTGRVFATQECLAILSKHAHFDLGMSGAPLLNTRTDCVVGVQAGVFPSSHSRPQPLGLAVPLSDVSLAWTDFERECRVLNYDPLLDEDIVPQSREFLRHESFTERLYWTSVVETFCTVPERHGGYLLLVGGAGAGKSAFMAHCIRNQIEPVFHFIRRTEPGWDDPERMLRSLTAQLGRKHGLEPSKHSAERLEAATSVADRARAAAALFADLMERTSEMLAAERRQEVIWIDGLDEAFGPTGRHHETPGLPALLPAQLPPPSLWC